MSTVGLYVEALGGASALARSLGIPASTVRNFVSRGEFPAMYFDAIERLLGRPANRSLFSFRELPDGKVGAAYSCKTRRAFEGADAALEASAGRNKARAVRAVEGGAGK